MKNTKRALRSHECSISPHAFIQSQSEFEASPGDDWPNRLSVTIQGVAAVGSCQIQKQSDSHTNGKNTGSFNGARRINVVHFRAEMVF